MQTREAREEGKQQGGRQTDFGEEDSWAHCRCGDERAPAQ